MSAAAFSTVSLPIGYTELKPRGKPKEVLSTDIPTAIEQLRGFNSAIVKPPGCNSARIVLFPTGSRSSMDYLIVCSAALRVTEDIILAEADKLFPGQFLVLEQLTVNGWEFLPVVPIEELARGQRGGNIVTRMSHLPIRVVPAFVKVRYLLSPGEEQVDTMDIDEFKKANFRSGVPTRAVFRKLQGLEVLPPESLVFINTTNDLSRFHVAAEHLRAASVGVPPGHVVVYTDYAGTKHMLPSAFASSASNLSVAWEMVRYPFQIQHFDEIFLDV